MSAARGGSVGRFLLRGGSFALAGRMAAVATGFAVQAALARLLRPEEMGAYFLAQSLVTTATLVAQMGLPRTLVRMLAEATGADDPARARATLRTGMRLGLGAIAAVSLVYGVVGRPLVAEGVFDSALLADVTWIVAVWIAITGVQNLLTEVFRGYHQIGSSVTFGGTLTSLLTAIALSAMLFAGAQADLARVLWVTIAATASNVLVAGFMLGQEIRHVAPGEPVPARLLMESALPMVVAAAAQSALAQSDLWIVGALQSSHDIALYGAAKRMIRLVSLPLVIVNLVVPPLIADLHARGELERLQRAIRGASTVAGLPSLVVLLAFILAAGPALRLVFGDFYAAAHLLLVLLSIERVLFVWAGPCGMLLMMTGHQRSMMNVTLLAGVVQVAAALAGAFVAGNLGVAVGVVVGAGLRSFAMWDRARRLTGVRTDVSLWHLGEMRATLQRLLGRGRRPGA